MNKSFHGTDDSVPVLTQIQLEAVAKNLRSRKQKLAAELKSKHKKFYDWLITNNISLANLSKYSKNIAAALSLTNQLVTQSPAPQPPPTPAPTPNITDNNDASQNNTTDPKVLSSKVWKDYGNIINTVAKRYDIDPQLIFATIMTESEGNPNAYRYEPHINDASYGLGQILYTTAQGLGFEGKPEDIYNPEVSIDLIGRYHKQTIDTYGLLPPERMTVVYNTGKLYGYPYPGHISRFKLWYYNYTSTRTITT